MIQKSKWSIVVCMYVIKIMATVSVCGNENDAIVSLVLTRETFFFVMV